MINLILTAVLTTFATILKHLSSYEAILSGIFFSFILMYIGLFEKMLFCPPYDKRRNYIPKNIIEQLLTAQICIIIIIRITL